MNSSNTNSRPPVRLAVVQFGYYAQDLRMIQAGGKEPYAGMRHSVEALEDLFSGIPHLVISLNAPPSREVVGDGLLLGIPSPPPRLWRRGVLNRRLWSRQVCEAIDSFQPTHLLMRASGYLALKVLELSTLRGWSTLALFANNFASQEWLGRRVEWQLPKYLNHPSVLWVGNHRKISTQSLIDHGVRAEKVISYDWPAARHPSQHSLKELDRAKPVELVFAANMIMAKGIGDLITAVGLLRRKGIDARLTAFGVGKDLERMRELANSIAPDAVTFPGQVDNDLLFKTMRGCTLMCVVTRPEFTEGGSLVLTEALASRTPTVLSDQVLFKQSFVDGEGVKFFRSGDPISLVQVIEDMISDENAYAKLSETTEAAFSRVEYEMTFGDLIARWKATFVSR
ncbi:MAG: glycosyltransferase [Pirellula sp.]